MLKKIISLSCLVLSSQLFFAAEDKSSFSTFIQKITFQKKGRSEVACSPQDIGLIRAVKLNDLEGVRQVLGRELPALCPEYDNDKDYHLWLKDFRNAVRCSQSKTLNKRDANGFTSLQLAAQNGNLEIVLLLLEDPRTNGSVRTADWNTARELVNTKEELHVLRQTIFARVSLESAVDKLCTTIKSNSFSTWENQEIAPENIHDAVKTIQEILAHKPSQSISLPDAGQQPSYVDNTFITKMLIARLYQP